MFVVRVENEGRTTTLKLKNSLKIGRGRDCAIRLKGGKASRSHAAIFVKDEKVFVCDLGSKNGTYVDGELISLKQIQPGTKVTVGDAVMTLEDVIDESELLGETVSGYKVVEMVGKGGMGVVFKATQISLDRPVALKVLNKSLVSKKGFIERFAKEARAAGQLNHPNLIQVHDFGKQDENYFFSMEFVAGPTVSQVLRRTKNFPEKLAVYVAREVAKAIDYAHSRDLIHRDIKPSNIMIDGEGNVKLADLGIAETLQNIEAQMKNGTVMGTPEYMSPEQASGAFVGPHSDLYSLGATLYHMVAGRPPFRGKTADILRKVINEEPPPVSEFAPHISQNLTGIIENLMEKEADGRISSATDVIKTIDDKWHWTPEHDTNRRKHLADFVKGMEEERQSGEQDVQGRKALFPMPTRWLIVGGIVLATILGVGLTFFALRKPPVIKKPPDKPPDNRIEQEQFLKEAEAARDKIWAYLDSDPDDLGNLERQARDFLSKYGDTPYAGEVREKFIKVRLELRKKIYLARAQSEYDSILEFADQNPQDIEGQWSKFRDFSTKWTVSPLAERAKHKMDLLQAEITRRKMDKFTDAVARAGAMAARGENYLAARTLEPYAKAEHPKGVREEALNKAKEYRKSYEAHFVRMKKALSEAMNRNRYGDGISACRDFISKEKQGGRVKEANGLIRWVETKAKTDYRAEEPAVHEGLKELSFENPEVLAQALNDKLKGTAMGESCRLLLERTRALRHLHTKVVDNIEGTTTKKMLPSKVSELGRCTAWAADPDTLEVDFGEIRQPLKWASLERSVVLEIYRIFLDERSRENQDMLRHFAKEFRIKGSKYYK